MRIKGRAIKTLLLLVVIPLTTTGVAWGQTSWAFKDVTTILPISDQGKVGMDAVYSHDGEKLAFLNPGFSSEALVTIKDNMSGAIVTLENTDTVRGLGQMTWSPNSQWVMYGDLAIATASEPDLQQISKVNISTGEVVSGILKASHLGLTSSTAGVMSPNVPLDNNLLLVYAYDFDSSLTDEERALGLYLVTIDSDGNPIDEGGDGLADEFTRLTTAPIIFQNAKLSNGVIISEIASSTNNREVWAIRDVAHGMSAVASMVDSRLFRVDDPNVQGYILGTFITSLGDKRYAVYARDFSGQYSEIGSANWNVINFDMVFVELTTLINGGGVVDFRLTTENVDEGAITFHPTATTVAFTNSNGLNEATLSALATLVVDADNDVVLEPFSMGDGFGMTLSAESGSVAITEGSGTLNIIVTIFTPSTPSADLEAALEGIILSSRNITMSTDVIVSITVQIDYPQARVANLNENDITFIASSGTVELVSLDTVNNRGIWTVTGFEASSGKGVGGGLEFVVGIPGTNNVPEVPPGAPVGSPLQQILLLTILGVAGVLATGLLWPVKTSRRS